MQDRPPIGGGSRDKSTLLTDTPSGSFPLTHHIPSGKLDSSGNQSACYADFTAGGSMADCTKQTAQMAVHLTGSIQVWQDQQTGVGGILCNIATLSCTTLSLKATIRIPRIIPVSLTGAVDMSFCFTNAAGLGHHIPMYAKTIHPNHESKTIPHELIRLNKNGQEYHSF